MGNASIDLTIDMAAFQRSLTAAFSMYEVTLKAMGQQSPQAMSRLTAELDKLIDKTAKPVILNADGTPMSAAITQASGEIDRLDNKAETSVSKIGQWWDVHKQTLSQFSLVYRGIMDVYNDVTRVFGSFITEQGEAQKASARVEAAVRSTGGAAGYTANELKKMAGSIEGIYAIDADSLLSQVTTPLLTFKAITGELFQDAQLQVMNMSRALGVDLQGAAMQVGKALQDPIEGLTALRRSGVSFSDSQQEVIKALFQTGQVAEAQKLILAELSTEFGGQAEAFATTGAGKIEALKISFDNLKESIGGGLLPVLTAFGAVASPMMGWFSSMNGVMQATVVLLPLATYGWYALMASQIATATVTGTLTAALTAASYSVKLFLVTIGPVGWAMMAITAAIVGVTAAINIKNKKEEESIRNQNQIIQKKRELISQQQGEASSIITLTQRYEALAGMTKRSAAETDEMRNIYTIIKDKYPALISSTDDFSGALGIMKNAAKAAKNELADLNRESAALALTQARVTVMETRREAMQAKSDVIGFVGDVGAAVRGVFGSTISTVQAQIGALGSAMKNDNAGAVKMWITEIDKSSGVFTRNENERWMLLKLAANDYLKALQDVADIQSGKLKPGTQASSSTPAGGGEPDSGTGMADPELERYKSLSLELANLRKTDLQKLDEDYADSLQLILKYTVQGSEQQRLQLGQLVKYRTDKSKEITDRVTADEQAAADKKKQLTEDKFKAEIDYYSNLDQLGVSSYDALKKTMEEYYAWAKQNLTKEEQAMILIQLRQTNLRWGQVKAREAEEAYAHEAEMAAIRDEFAMKDLNLSGNTYAIQLIELDNYYAARKEKLLKAGITEQQIEEQKAKAISKLQIASAASAASGAAGILGNLASLQDKESEKGFKTWKALSLAQAMLDMPAAALAAYKSMAGIPIVGPALGVAAAAAAVAMGLKNISDIQKTKYEKKALGGILNGNSHANGGIIIEAEGDEYITSKDRVKAVGQRFFDFINFAPLQQVKGFLGKMAMPGAFSMNMPLPNYSYAGGGTVSNNGGGMDYLVNGIREELKELKTAILGNKPVINIEVDPLSSNPVKVSEIAEQGAIMRSSY